MVAQGSVSGVASEAHGWKKDFEISWGTELINLRFFTVLKFAFISFFQVFIES